MQSDRRSFVKGALLAAAGASFPKVLNAATARPDLRVGILSDIHIVQPQDPEHVMDTFTFEKALRYFDSLKVDAVLVAGDLTINGRRSELEAVAGAWQKVFPKDRRSDGGKVEKLFITGNHDVDGWIDIRYKDLAAARAESFYFNRKRFWKELFGESYKPVFVKEVKGYRFVMRNWLSVITENLTPLTKQAGCRFELKDNPTERFLASLELPSDKPFFYVQHDPADNTVNATWQIKGRRWPDGHDHGETTKFLSKYPNVIALTGHSHNSLTDELSIWQGAFTAVNCSCSCGYVFTPPGRENGWSVSDFNRQPPFEMPPLNIRGVRQGLVMDVWSDRVVFHRREFVNDRQLGPDWVVPVGPGAAKPYTVEARLKSAERPAFPKDAAVTVKSGEGRGRNAAGTGATKETHPQVFVTFPAVRTQDGSPVRGWDYAVRCEFAAGDSLRTICERQVFSPGSLLAEADDTEPVTCAFARSDVPQDRSGAVRFIVTPRSCWGVEGEPISTPWLTKIG